MAHIGVIRWLTEHRFEIRSISGASIGALVGGVYASGRLDAFETWVRGLSRSAMLALMDLSWERGGLVKGDRFLDALSRFAPRTPIEDLPIAYTAVAAELATGKEFWLRSGDLLRAVRASISLPLLFTPYDHNGVLLIDGGVLNPVPIAPTFGDDTDLTIAVSLNGTPEFDATPEPSGTGGQAGALSPEILQWFDRLQTLFRPDADRDADRTAAEAAPTSASRTPDAGEPGAGVSDEHGDDAGLAPLAVARASRRDWSAYEVAYLAFDAMQATIARQKLAAYPPDEVVEISRSACRTLEFDRAAELIRAGYDEAARVLGPLLEPGGRKGS